METYKALINLIFWSKVNFLHKFQSPNIVFKRQQD